MGNGRWESGYSSVKWVEDPPIRIGEPLFDFRFKEPPLRIEEPLFNFNFKEPPLKIEEPLFDFRFKESPLDLNLFHPAHGLMNGGLPTHIQDSPFIRDSYSVSLSNKLVNNFYNNPTTDFYSDHSYYGSPCLAGMPVMYQNPLLP